MENDEKLVNYLVDIELCLTDEIQATSETEAIAAAVRQYRRLLERDGRRVHVRAAIAVTGA